MDRPAATWLVGAATRARVDVPSSRILNALVHDRPWHAFGDGFPFSAADINVLGLGDRTADGVANISIAGFCHDLAGRVALITPASLSDWSADGVALIAVASRVTRFADGVALISPARLHARNADGVALISVARLIARHLDRADFIAPAGLRHRTTNRVALIAIASFVASSRTADRDLFANLIIDGLAANFFTTIPDNFLHRLVASCAAILCLAQITTGCAG